MTAKYADLVKRLLAYFSGGLGYEAAAAIEALVADLRQEEREHDLALRLAFIDAGANPPITWKDEATRCAAKNARLREALDSIARDTSDPNAISKAAAALGENKP